MSRVFLAGIVVEGRRCVVFGSNHEAAAKARALAEAGAVVEIVAEETTDEITALVAANAVARVVDSPRIAHTAGAFLVVSAIADEAWSRALYAQATGDDGFLLCCIDQPAYCTFTNVASVRRGPVQIAVATDGRAPMLAARMREGIASSLDETFAAFAERIATLRDVTEPGERRAVLEKALEGFAVELRAKVPGGKR